LASRLRGGAGNSFEFFFIISGIVEAFVCKRGSKRFELAHSSSDFEALALLEKITEK
jgi:hypothetical protein